MMKNEVKRVYSFVIRYLILLIVAMNIWLFYAIFTPLTIYPVYYLLKLFFSVSLSGTIITLKGIEIHLIQACIAGSAYLLLLILNLTTQMKLKTRIYSLIFLFSSFLIINILRIFIFSLLFINLLNLFNTLHLVFWYFLSTIIVVSIWLINIKIFKIKQIPVYDDIRFLMNSKQTKNPKRSK